MHTHSSSVLQVYYGHVPGFATQVFGLRESMADLLARSNEQAFIAAYSSVGVVAPGAVHVRHMS